MAWMGFGIRGPGGSRTGSVVAVTMLVPSSVLPGHRAWLRAGLTVSVAGTSRTNDSNTPETPASPRAV